MNLKLLIISLILNVVTIKEKIESYLIYVWYLIIGEKVVCSVECKQYVNGKLVKVCENKKLRKELLKRNLLMSDILKIMSNISLVQKTIIEIKYRIKNRYYIFVLDGTEGNIDDIINNFNNHFSGLSSVPNKTNKEILLIQFDVETSSNLVYGVHTETNGEANGTSGGTISGTGSEIKSLYSKKALDFINMYIENKDIETRIKRFEVEERLIELIKKDNRNEQIKKIKSINLFINDSSFLNITF
jgi:hypothetical protein